ncbi:phage head closure protein [Eubacteriales bacterium OttesenSCG-928-A19]|nr:phage head closure protein [Eubacteriales bacterium OttesenSCG-928-A19]
MKKLKDKKIQLIEKDGNYYYPIHPGTVWVYYRHLSAHEETEARINGFKLEVQFVINWRDDLEEGMFVKHAGIVYEITQVDDYQGYKGDLKLSCTKLLRGITVKEYQGE